MGYGASCPDCNKFVHGLSRWCSRRHGLSLRYGSPRQERVLRRDTKPYERVVARLIASNKNHPAIVLVVGELRAPHGGASRAVSRLGLSVTIPPQDDSARHNRPCR